MKKTISILITLILLLGVLPVNFAQVAQATPGTYHTGDIAIINGLVDAGVIKGYHVNYPGSGLFPKIPDDGSSVPAQWTGYIFWSDDVSGKRIVEINFRLAYDNIYNGNEPRDVSVKGDLDLRGLDKLKSLRIDGGSVRAGPAMVSTYYHGATSVNVSGCTELTNINVTLGHLTAMNLSGCTALKTLSCGSNDLPSLDVSSYPALIYLSCGGNPITSLDVSQNPALTNLYCSTNELTSLDVSQNPRLIALNCSVNQLTSLDVSQNPALTTLYCYNNALTSLDMSKNPVLEYLDCNNNELTSLDMRKNPVLHTLDCRMNYLKRIKVTGTEYVSTFLFTPQKPITAETTVIMRIDRLYAVVDGVKVKVNDAQDLTPIFNDTGRTMVPFRFIATCFEAGVDWDEGLGSAIIDYKGKHIQIPIGQPFAFVDGVKTPINAPAQIMTLGRTFVPFRAVSELLGDTDLAYDPGTMTIIASDGDIDVAACVAEYDAVMK